jgi:hypothetical protein
VVPFVVQLVGEYVVEILESIRHHLSDLTSKRSTQRLAYGDFIARNPGFFARTEHRVVSYWACYHRGKFPDFGTYPGGHPCGTPHGWRLSSVKLTATHQANAHLPGPTPVV